MQANNDQNPQINTTPDSMQMDFQTWSSRFSIPFQSPQTPSQIHPHPHPHPCSNLNHPTISNSPPPPSPSENPELTALRHHFSNLQIHTQHQEKRLQDLLAKKDAQIVSYLCNSNQVQENLRLENQTLRNENERLKGQVKIQTDQLGKMQGQIEGIGCTLQQQDVEVQMLWERVEGLERGQGMGGLEHE